MRELDPQQRQELQGLFVDYPYLHGLVCGILSGEFGQAFADRDVGSMVGMLSDDGFIFFAGDAGSASAAQMIASCRPGDLLVPATDPWRTAIREVWRDRLTIKQRVAFTQPDSWNRIKLRKLISDLPSTMTLKQIMPVDVARFAALAKSLVELDSLSGEASMGNGIGFGVEYNEAFLSGCAGWPAGGMVELEIQTHPNHRRRGLATVAAAALVDYCLAHDLTPCWDAANDMSVGLALKLGFVNPTRYEAYLISS